MLNIPEEVKWLFKKDSVKKNFRVHFPNGERADICNPNIVNESVYFTESICSQDELKFGLCEASVISFQTLGIENIKGYTIECQIEIDCTSLVDEGFEDVEYKTDLDYPIYAIPYGTFVVDSCPRDANNMERRNVEAYSLDISVFNEFTQTTLYDQIINKPFWRNDDLNIPIGAIVDTIQPNIRDYDYRSFENASTVYAKSYNFGSVYNNIIIHGKSRNYGFQSLPDISTWKDYIGFNQTISIGTYKISNLFDFNRKTNEVIEKVLKILPQSLLSQKNKVRKWLVENCVISYPNYDTPQINTDGSYSITPFSYSSENKTYYFHNKKEKENYINSVVNKDGIYQVACYSSMDIKSDSLAYVTEGGIRFFVPTYIEVIGSTKSDTTIINLDSLLEVKEISQYYTSTNSEAYRHSVNGKLVIDDALNSLYVTLKRNRSGTESVLRVTKSTFAETFTKRTSYYTDSENMLTELTSREILESYIELEGLFGMSGRDGIFKKIAIGSSLPLYPSEKLFPSETLYPSDGIYELIPQQLWSQVWYDDEYTKPYGSVSTRYRTLIDGEETEAEYTHDMYDFDSEDSFHNRDDFRVYDLSDNAIIQENVFTESQIASILANMGETIKNVQYMPADINCKGLPYVEVGDTLEVLTNDNGGFNTFSLRRSLRGIQSLKDNHESK